MESVKYKYREHSKSGKVFHGEIELKSDISGSERYSVKIKMDIEYNYGGKWKNAICFGIDYFSSFLFNKEKENISLNIEIIDIGWYPIDTNHAVMTYVTIKALCLLYKIEIEGLDFNKESGTLTLPSC